MTTALLIVGINNPSEEFPRNYGTVVGTNTTSSLEHTHAKCRYVSLGNKPWHDMHNVRYIYTTNLWPETGNLYKWAHDVRQCWFSPRFKYFIILI